MVVFIISQWEAPPYLNQKLSELSRTASADGELPVPVVFQAESI